MKYLILTLLTLSLLTSCDKDETPSPNTNGINTLSGSVTQFDYISPDSVDNSNIHVSVVSNNQTLQTTLTDSLGQFQFDNLQIGTYDILITKPGYATYRNRSIYHGVGPNPTLFTPPSTAFGYLDNPLVRQVYSDITSATLDSNKNGILYFCINVNVDARDNLSKLKPYVTQMVNYYTTISYDTEIKKVQGNKIIFGLNKAAYTSGTQKLNFYLSTFRESEIASFNIITIKQPYRNIGNFQIINAYKELKNVEITIP